MGKKHNHNLLDVFCSTQLALCLMRRRRRKKERIQTESSRVGLDWIEESLCREINNNQLVEILSRHKTYRFCVFLFLSSFPPFFSPPLLLLHHLHLLWAHTSWLFFIQLELSLNSQPSTRFLALAACLPLNAGDTH